MSARNLEFLFRPKSVAVIGASETPGSYGAVAIRNIKEGGFTGAILPVNLRHHDVCGLPAYTRIGKLPLTPELAIICTRLATVPRLIAELGKRGTRAAIILTPEVSDGQGETASAELHRSILNAARPHLLRIVGPGSCGLILPSLRLNASLAHAMTVAGKVAFVSQSAAVASAVLDRVQSEGFGLSCLLHLGDSLDVDVADVLDYLATDPETRAVLLHLESLSGGRKFMSAARAAARGKPVAAMRSGWSGDGGLQSATRAGRLLETDAVYDTALRRAGILRVFTTEGLFEAAEALIGAKPLTGERLAIIANGVAPLHIALDVLRAGKGMQAPLTAAATRLDVSIGPSWRRDGGVVLPYSASPKLFADSVRAVIDDPATDGVVLIQSPTAFATGSDIAAAVSEACRGSEKNVLPCWLGGESAVAARSVASAGGLPSYDTPEGAVRVFLGIVQYHRNHALLMQAPPSRPAGFRPDRERARKIVRHALKAGRERLTELEARALLAAYGIAVAENPTAGSGKAAVALAEHIGYPVHMKAVIGKSAQGADVDAIVRDLESAAEVKAAARKLRKDLHLLFPRARVRGFELFRPTPRPGARELLVAVTTDRVFGPVLLFGQGGEMTTVIRDIAVALPPVNQTLAEDLIGRTRVSKLLAGGERPPVDQEALCLTLIQVSQLIDDVEEIVELEINPLLADNLGVLALQAQIHLAPPGRLPASCRFAIRPYPQELEQRLVWDQQPLLIRPIRPEDEAAHAAFLGSLAPEDLHFRFFGTMRQMSHGQLARFTQIDYDREMAFVAVLETAEGPKTIGEVRAVTDPANIDADFAVVVRSDLKGHGLGRILVMKMIDYCSSRGTRVLRGEVLADNDRMLLLAKRCGFASNLLAGEGQVALSLGLQAHDD